MLFLLSKSFFVYLGLNVMQIVTSFVGVARKENRLLGGAEKECFIIISFIKRSVLSFSTDNGKQKN